MTEDGKGPNKYHQCGKDLEISNGNNLRMVNGLMLLSKTS